VSCVGSEQDADDLESQPLAKRRNMLAAASQRPTSEVASAAVGPAESQRHRGATPLSRAESASLLLIAADFAFNANLRILHEVAGLFMRGRTGCEFLSFTTHFSFAPSLLAYARNARSLLTEEVSICVLQPAMRLFFPVTATLANPSLYHWSQVHTPHSATT